MYCDLPVPELMDGALRFGGSRFFFGRIVSLLGFKRRLPSTRPEAERSWFPIVACATDGTVSVSTVMLRSGGSARDLVDSDESDGFEVTVFGRCVEAARRSCILPFLADLVALSLPLSVLLLLLLALPSLALRSSVIFDELTSLRSSSVFACVVDRERKLRVVVSKGCVRSSGPWLAAVLCVAMTKSGAVAGKAYLCGSRPSNPGVAGRLDSWTVSSLGAAPLTPREGALVVMTSSSGSLAGASSRTGKRACDAGEELWTTMAGVDWASGFLIWERSELARERERPSSLGGGDRRRGEMGQWGVESPAAEAEVDLGGRGGRTVSVEDVGVSSGMLVADRARWIEAAEGVLALEAAGLGTRLGTRLGLTSALVLRERKPDLAAFAGGAAGRWGGRAGEASREESGDVADEGEPDTLSERAPSSGGLRRGAGAPSAGAGAAAGPFWACSEGLSRGVVGAAAGVAVGVEADEVEADAGSADSTTPASDW